MGANLSFPVVNLHGQVALITGGNTGIGYETAKALAVMGAHTIIACRSAERANTAVEKMKEEIGGEHPDISVTIEWMLCDLSSFRSVKDFVINFKQKNIPLNLLINNAGVAWLPFTMTEDGYEAQFQVNHLSHFLLSLELLPVMSESAATSKDCRIVFVASRLHAKGSFSPGNMNAEMEYSRTGFYGNSKLYNVMTAYALQRRLVGTGITVSSVHPGSVETELGRNTVDNFWLNFFYKAYKIAIKPVLRDAQAGATTTLNCAVNPKLKSQTCIYYADCRPAVSSLESRCIKYQEQLWEISVSIVKEWLSVAVLDQYGPTMGFEEEEEEHTSETRPILSFDDSQQVLISADVNGGSARVSFRKSTLEADDDEEEEEGGTHNGGRNTTRTNAYNQENELSDLNKKNSESQL